MTRPLQQRVVGILVDPAREWPTIAGEPETVATLYRQYVMLLAAIGPLALFLRYPSLTTLVMALLQWGMQLAAVYLSTMVIQRLAPRFRSSGSTVTVMQLVAYSNTAPWIAGATNLLGLLSTPIVFIAGLYGIYLFYVGLPVLLKTPPEQRVPFMVVSAIVILAVAMVLSTVISAIVGGTLFAVI